MDADPALRHHPGCLDHLCVRAHHAHPVAADLLWSLVPGAEDDSIGLRATRRSRLARISNAAIGSRRDKNGRITNQLLGFFPPVDWPDCMDMCGRGHLF